MGWQDDPVIKPAQQAAAPWANDPIIKAAPKPSGHDFSLNTDKLAAVGQGIKDAAGGAVRSGMGIVSNLMRPFEAMIPGGEDGSSGNDKRMARVDSRFRGKGYNPDATAFKGGKLAGDIGLTLPVGGALGSVAGKLPALQTALRTGGFRAGLPAAPLLSRAGAGQMALRTGAGATVGGASTALVDPEHAGTGAIIGGALPGVVKAMGVTGKVLNRGADAGFSNLMGAATGTGAESIRESFRAGKNGATAFLDNMRGKVPFDDVVAQAKGALGNMRMQRSQAYRSGMVDISNDATVIPFSPIQDAVSKVSSMGSYKGQAINKHAAGTVNELAETVQNWGALNPAEFHTPEGLDALKQAIGDIRDTTQFGTSARRAADTVYNAVKDEITRQAPTYAKVMKDYSEASSALQEVERTLSLTDKAATDTAVRKLQSVLRNNAQTNYGNRQNLVNMLKDKGGADLMPALAGQSMSSAMPRGISGAISKVGGGGMALMNPASIPMLLGAAPFTSPRLVGEALYKAGRGVGAAGKAAQSVKQNALRGMLPQGMNLSDLGLLRTLPIMAIPEIQTNRQ